MTGLLLLFWIRVCICTGHGQCNIYAVWRLTDTWMWMHIHTHIQIYISLLIA